MTETHFTGEVFQETYVLERVIGEGGMGRVYEASHRRLTRRFAVKILFGEHTTNPQALARFEREAQIAGGLGHPHIVEVIDFNRTKDGRPYIVMELLVGEDLAARLDRVSPLPLDQAVEIVRQTASALQAVHQAGVVHRDLKPHNIFLCRSSEGPDHVKVVDFGVSKMVGPGKAMTQSGTLLGTPYYMAPEQALEHSGDVDARTDVYALGAILYEILAGAPPYQADAIPTLLHKIVYDPLPSLQTACPDLPPAVVAVVERALAKRQDDRFPSMRAFWHALGEATNHPILALARSVSQPAHRLTSDDAALAATLPPEGGAGAPSVPRDLTLAITSRRRRSWVLPAAALTVVAAIAVLVALRQASPPAIVAPHGAGSRGASRPDLRGVDASRPDLAPARGDLRLVAPDLPPPDAARVRHRDGNVRRSLPAELNLITVDESGGIVAAEVRLDGQPRGQAPIHLRDLRARAYRLEVSAPDFQPAQRRLVLRPGPNRIRIGLKR